MHLDDEQIQRLMHGELDAPARAEAMRHVMECPACSRGLEAARREEAEVFALFEHLDHDAPVVDAASFTALTRGRVPAWTRRAAGVVVAAALAGAAYAIPGSPLPALVRQLASTFPGHEPAAPPARGGDVSTPAQPATSGIAVPAGDHFVIRFAATQEHGSVTVRLTDDGMVRVRVTGGTVAFTTDNGRLDIGNRGSSADYEIEIPRSAVRIEIRVADTARFVKDRDRVTTGAGSIGPGQYRLGLDPAR
jgi:anti-sigma factor RsiW